MSEDSNVTKVKLPDRDVGLELSLGLAPEDAVLMLEPGSRCQDLQPWLLDAVAVKIPCLGHHDKIPRPWDWENVLTLLEPGEELLYVLDHRSAISTGRAGEFSLWLAIRFPSCTELGPEDLVLREKRARVLISQICRQAFPGSEVEWVEPQALLGLLGTSTGPEERCVVVTGMPSPRSLKDGDRDIDRESVSRNYQSLNDVVEALYDLQCDYRIAFVVQRVGNATIQEKLELATSLYNQVHPLVQTSNSASANWSSNTNLGVTTSQSEADNLNSSKAVSENESTQHGKNKSAGINLVIINGNVSESESKTTGQSWTHTETEGKTFTTTSGVSETTGETRGLSRDITVENVDSQLRLAEFTLERTIDALHEAYGTGGFRWGAFAFAEGHNVEIVGRSLMGVLAGARTKDHPLVRFEVKGEHDRLLASRIPTMDLVADAAPVLSLPRVCDALLVPEAELPGLRLRRNVFLGRNVDTNNGSLGTIVLGPDAFSAIGAEFTPADIKLPEEDLFKHILVAGTTGSGKTTRVVEILNRIESPQLSVLVVETAKRTYRKEFQRRKRSAPIVYRLGSSATYGVSRFRPLRVNPFYFELGTSLKRHIAILSDALAELMPTEAMIGSLMRRAVECCYDERGWDIEAGMPYDGAAPTWPTVVDFILQVRILTERLNYGPEVNANYRGALESRASLFMDATFQDIFGYGGNTPIDELVPLGKDAIIEVEDLPPSDVDVRAFVITLLLSRLRAVQSVRGQGANIEKKRVAEPVVQQTNYSCELKLRLQEFFKGRDKRLTKYIKSILRDGKVIVDGKVINNGRQIVNLESIIEADGQIVHNSRSEHTVSTLSTTKQADCDPLISLSRSNIWQVQEELRDWLVVFEEAHNVLDRQFEERRPTDESNAGRTLLRSVVRLLQEGRAMRIGIMVIDQSPTKLARDVIANTGTKLTLRLEDSDEMAEIGRSIGLEEDAWQKLGFLQVGEALVKTSYMDRPAKSAPFRTLSDPPSELYPRDAVYTPSFTAIAAHWSPLSQGKGYEPDGVWTESLLQIARGNVHLAVFGGLRSLLMVEAKASTMAAITSLRNILAERSPNRECLTQVAKELWAEVVCSTYREQLRQAAVIVCHMLVPSSAWRTVALTSAGIEFIATLLVSMGLESYDSWVGFFSRTQSMRGRNRGVAGQADFIIKAGLGNRTAVVRALLRSAMTEHENGGTPIAMIIMAEQFVASAIAVDFKGVSLVEQTAVEDLLIEIEEQLALQIATAVGQEHARGVSEVFKMQRFS